jgi:hypothetical protein
MRPAVGQDRDDLPEVAVLGLGTVACDLCGEEFYELAKFLIEDETGFRWGRRCPRRGCTYAMCYTCILRLPMQSPDGDGAGARDATCPACRMRLGQICRFPPDLLEWRRARDAQTQELQDSYDAIYAEAREALRFQHMIQLGAIQRVIQGRRAANAANNAADNAADNADNADNAANAANAVLVRQVLADILDSSDLSDEHGETDNDEDFEAAVDPEAPEGNSD